MDTNAPPDPGLVWSVLILNTATVAHFLSQDVVGVVLVTLTLWAVGGGRLPRAMVFIPAPRLVRMALAFQLALGGVATIRELLDVGGTALGAALAATTVLGWAALRLASPRQPRRLVLVALLAALGVLLACWLTLPARIDVAVFQEVASSRLLDGVNPYAFGYPDVYDPAESAQVYAPGLSVDGTLQAGFPYPPMSLLLATGGALFGDIRIAHALAVLGAVALLATLAPGSWSSRVGAATLATSPLVAHVVRQGWTEPFVIVALVGVFWTWRRGLAPALALGAFLSIKQYAVVVLPVILGLVPWPSPLRTRLRLGAGAALLAMISAVPFLVMSSSEFFYSVGLWQFAQPFRTDAMSLPSVLSVWTGPPPSWALLLATATATALATLVVLRARPRGWGQAALGVAIVMIVFLLTGKQAFTNYYTFALGALCVGLSSNAVVRPSLVGLERGAVSHPEDVHHEQDHDEP